jgi:large subunit ribosomal protein L16
MLQPKRTKFRKQHKGRNRGLAFKGSDVSFGEFGLKSTGRGLSLQGKLRPLGVLSPDM